LTVFANSQSSGWRYLCERAGYSSPRHTDYQQRCCTQLSKGDVWPTAHNSHTELQRSDLTSGGTDRMAIGMSVGFTHAGAAPVSGSPVTRPLTGASCSGEAIFVLAASITRLGSRCPLAGQQHKTRLLFFAACKWRGRGPRCKGITIYGSGPAEGPGP